MIEALTCGLEKMSVLTQLIQVSSFIKSFKRLVTMNTANK